MFEIRFDNQAADFLKKCDKTLFERIKSKISILVDNPIPHDSKRVLGYEEPTFRIRIGKYRALYRVNHKENRIIIVKIDHREKVY